MKNKNLFIVRGTGFPQLDGSLVDVVVWDENGVHAHVVPYNIKNVEPIILDKRLLQPLGEKSTIDYVIKFDKIKDGVKVDSHEVVIDKAFRDVNVVTLLNNFCGDLSKALKGE